MRGFLTAALLSTALFLNIVTQCISEYMVFSIYTDSFPDEQSLAKFFGLMSGALNFVGMAIGLWLTEPLMRRLGVARMNMVFPAACGISVLAMLASPLLPVAMFAHIVYDGLSNNIDAPVTAINYNAIPERFVGRLRVFNDSLIYPIALAVSGLLIWVVAQFAGFARRWRAGRRSQPVLPCIWMGYRLALCQRAGRDIAGRSRRPRSERVPDTRSIGARRDQRCRPRRNAEGAGQNSDQPCSSYRRPHVDTDPSSNQSARTS